MCKCRDASEWMVSVCMCTRNNIIDTVEKYLVLEVSMILEDGPLISSSSNIILHHVLLLR